MRFGSGSDAITPSIGPADIALGGFTLVRAGVVGVSSLLGGGTRGLGSASVVNRANHLFGPKSITRHNLGGFLNKFSGNQVNAFHSIQSATQKLVSSGKIHGVFESIVKVREVNATVRGRVIDGNVRVATAFIPSP
jgi:hypothetical protein